MRHQRRFVDTHQAVAVEKALGKLHAGRIAFCARHFFRHEPIRPKTPGDLIGSWQNWLCLSGDHIVEQHVHNIDIANWFAGGPPVACVGFGGRARRPAGDMYDFFSIDYDYGQGVHVHSMCRQVSGCWNWVGHDLVYERGHTSGSDGPAPKASPWPGDLREEKNGHLQEQVNVLYYVLKGRPLDQARAVATSTATAVMGRIAAYTGRRVTWEEVMADAKKTPELYNQTLKPTAEDFQTGGVAMPKEGVVAVPGTPAAPRRR
jgi:predicted dehydrogenase